jgi:hypothetical protein
MFSCLREDGVQRDSRNDGYPNHEFSVLYGSEEHFRAMILFAEQKRSKHKSAESSFFEK